MPDLDIRTTDLIAGGDTIGRLPDGRAVFVAGGAPNEHVRVRLTKETARWARGTATEILEPSASRVPPPFPAAQLGGATWAHIAYGAQLAAKERIVRDALRRIGGLTDTPIRPITASPQEWGYRNRIAYAFAEREDGIVLGTLLPGSDTQIDPAQGSALFGESAAGLLERISAWANAASHPIWSPRGNREGLRNVIFRRSVHGNELVVHLVATSGIAPDPSLVGYFDELPVTGIVWSANDARDQVARFDRTTVLAGSRVLTERVGTLRLSYDATSFFQANVEAAELLLAALQEQLAGSVRITDLYAGVGLMGFGAAGSSTPLTLVESHRQAIDDAKRNAAALDRESDTISVGSTAANYLVRNRLLPDTTVIVDPPRTGLERQVIDALLRDMPERIAYVSCDPATLARDLKLLVATYQPTSIQPFDFFPQTPHIETLAVLTRK